jgi:hypothetical protein
MLNTRYDVMHTCPHNVLIFFFLPIWWGREEVRWEGEEDSMEAQVAVEKKIRKKTSSSMRTLGMQPMRKPLESCLGLLGSSR